MYLGGRKEPDFIAILKYRTKEEGGRQGPAFPRYRPQVQFSFSKSQTSGEQVFIDKDIVWPGELVKAKITLLDHLSFRHSLEIGHSFEFKEGSRIIGTGEILEIINENLKKKTSDKC